MAADFPKSLLRLLKTSIPSFAAAEVLLSMVEQTGKFWQPSDFIKANEPSANMRQVEVYLNDFRTAGIVQKTERVTALVPRRPISRKRLPR